MPILKIAGKILCAILKIAGETFKIVGEIFLIALKFSKYATRPKKLGCKK